MPVPYAPHVSLAADEQHRLETIVHAHSTPQALSLRCQLILRAAAADHPANLQVAKDLSCDRHTVYMSARRFFEQGRVGIGTDEKTGMQILERAYPPSLLNPANRKNASTSTSVMAHGY